MWRAYHRARTTLDTAVERQLVAEGLSSADLQLLIPLSESPDGGVRARDLARGAGWDRSRLSHQLRRMEARGLVARSECSTDARGTMVALTPTGRAAIEAAAPGHVATVRAAFVDLLQPEEVEVLTRVYERVAATGEQACAGADDAC